MKDKWQIILSGVGGQGLIACGGILAEASTLYDNKNATLTSSYGIETRGTFSKSDIIISGDDIYYPEVIKPDVVMSLAQVAYNRYVASLDEDAVMVYDSALVTNVKESRARQYGHPFTVLAREMGQVAVANMIALGTIIKLTGMTREESIFRAIQDKYGDKPKVASLNVEAIKKGMALP